MPLHRLKKSGITFMNSMKSLIPLCLLIVIVFHGAGFFHCSVNRNDAHVRIMTFNIHHGEGIDSVYNVQRIARFIQSHKADIIGCQEIDRMYSERSRFEKGPRKAPTLR